MSLLAEMKHMCHTSHEKKTAFHGGRVEKKITLLKLWRLSLHVVLNLLNRSV